MKQKLSNLKHPSNFSRPQLTIFVLVFALTGGYLLYRSFAAGPLVASMEAEQMSLPAGGSVVTDSTASAGQAIKLATNGSASGSVNFPSSVTSVTVNAKGTQCQGAPAMTVALDGANLLANTSVSSTAWSSYSVTPPNAINAGAHSLSISFTNDYSKTKGNPKSRCSRDLYIDVSNFYGPTPAPTPSPTVTLSASPTSVTAGQASTLTWGSTNATSCTASGAWSGSQATSGSASTGALNQNSTYTMTCSGTGGSASASTTVTVSAVAGGGTATVDDLWYSSTSAWNTPIPTNPSIHPNSSAFINGFNTWCPNQGCFGAADYYSVPGIWKATNSTPLVTVEVNWPTTCRQSTVQVPIPAGAIPSASGDPEPTMAIMQSSTGEEWDFWKVTPPGVTPRNSSGPQNCPPDSNWQAVAVFHFSPGWTGSGIGTSSRASGTLSGAGTIRPRDTKMPAGSTWEHALAIAYLGTTSVHVAPALSSDGQCTDSNACIPEGARLQLDPSINCSTWPSLSAEWLRQECRTLQKYGAIVVDSGNGFIAENVVSAQGTNPAADGGGTGYQWPWNSGGATSLPADLVPHLRVLSW